MEWKEYIHTYTETKPKYKQIHLLWSHYNTFRWISSDPRK